MKGKELWIACLVQLVAIWHVSHTQGTSIEESSNDVMYVTGCLGSARVTLHEATSARDALDVRAVFVYKGSEILGSDIIPSQGDYEGRLRISRHGEVTLTDLRLTDSGVFRVEMAKRDSKTSTQVVLVLQAAPTTQDNTLSVGKTQSPSDPDVTSLTCGQFTSLGYPPASVLWKAHTSGCDVMLTFADNLSSTLKDLYTASCDDVAGYSLLQLLESFGGICFCDPDGRLLSSSRQTDQGQFHLDVTATSPPGNYTCLLRCHMPHSCCLPPHSRLLRETPILLPPPRRVTPTASAPQPPPLPTSQPSPDMTSALKKAGEAMATGMAALVNEQMRNTLRTAREEREAWQRAAEDRLEQRFQRMAREHVNTARRGDPGVAVVTKETAAAPSQSPRRSRNERTGSGSDVSKGNTISFDSTNLASDVYNRVEVILKAIQTRLDRSDRNITQFQRATNRQMQGFLKKLKSVRHNMKKHGLSKHLDLIQRLGDQMEDGFKKVEEKFSDFESAQQGKASSDETVKGVQRTLQDLSDQMQQGQASVGRAVGSVTERVENLQANVQSLEERLERHKIEHETRRRAGSTATGNGVNDTKLKLEREEGAGGGRGRGSSSNSPLQAGPILPTGREATSEEARRGYQESVSSEVTLAASESCVVARQKGGSRSGSYPLRPDGLDVQNFWCDMETDGGGWLVFQRRRDGSEEFYRPWLDYAGGFGDAGGNGEFWLGLDKLHLLTSSGPHSMRVDLRTFDGQEGHALYRHFRVLGAHQNYLMDVHGYSGTAGDSLIVHDSQMFSTWNEDHDAWPDGHCAENYRSAWWYAGCRICDLNAPYTTTEDGIMWLYGSDLWGAGKIAFVEMKIRRK